MSQRQVERPQEKKPRPTGNTGPTLDYDTDIGDVDDILKELDIIEHPEKYTPEQVDCGCLRPARRGGFR
jgi:hypothetical protein